MIRTYNIYKYIMGKKMNGGGDNSEVFFHVMTVILVIGALISVILAIAGVFQNTEDVPSGHAM